MKKARIRFASALLALVMFCALYIPAAAAQTEYTMSNSYKSGSYYTALMNVKLTGDMRKDVIAVAKSQVGYHEGSSGNFTGSSSSEDNYTEFGRFYAWYAKTYYGDSYDYSRVAWCGTFVSFVLYMAKVPSTVVHLSGQANPTAFRLKGSEALSGSTYKKFTQTVIKGGSYTPQPGDLLFYAYSEGSDSYRHIAIVESATIGYDSSGKKIMTIRTFEGNCSNKVKNYEWTFDSSSSGRVYSSMYVVGFGIPNYATSSSHVDPAEEGLTGYDIGAYGGSLLKSGSSGSQVAKLQSSLTLVDALSSSYSCACEVTGTFDSATETAVKAYQTAAGLEVDGIVGSGTWGDLRTRVNTLVNAQSGDFIVKSGRLLLYKGTGENVVLPEGCTTIGGWAFANSKVKTVTLVKDFRAVKAYAFYNATKLTKVIHQNSESVSVSVSSTGNSAYKSAEHVYTVRSYEITFNLNGAKLVKDYEEGEIPSYNGKLDIESETKTMHFIGWDKPIVPACEDTTYTALYYTVSKQPIALTTSEPVYNDDGTIQIDVIASCSSPVSSFSFTFSYSDYADRLVLLRTNALKEGLQVSCPVEGIVHISRESGEDLTGTFTVLQMVFSVSEDVMREKMYLYLSCGEDEGFYSISGNYSFDLNVDCGCGILTVDRTAAYDYDSNGKLEITDVTAMLNDLAEDPFCPKSINDITNLLNALSRIVD